MNFEIFPDFAIYAKYIYHFQNTKIHQNICDQDERLVCDVVYQLGQITGAWYHSLHQSHIPQHQDICGYQVK